jgi:hypothetical protein
MSITTQTICQGNEKNKKELKKRTKKTSLKTRGFGLIWGIPNPYMGFWQIMQLRNLPI